MKDFPQAQNLAESSEGGRQRSYSQKTDESKESEEPEIDVEKLRGVFLDKDSNTKSYSNNAINNCKYTWYSFAPVVLFNQFKYFFNLFFLLIALSQIIPALRVGFLIAFVAPLVFVLAVTMIKEYYDDRSRYLKDQEINGTLY